MQYLTNLLNQYAGSFIKIEVNENASSNVNPLYFTSEDFKRATRTKASLQRLTDKYPNHKLGRRSEVKRSVLRKELKDGKVSEENIKLLTSQIQKSQNREHVGAMVEGLLEKFKTHLGDKLVYGCKGSVSLNTQEVEVYFFGSNPDQTELDSTESRLAIERYRTNIGTLEDVLIQIKDRKLSSNVIPDIENYYSESPEQAKDSSDLGLE